MPARAAACALGMLLLVGGCSFLYWPWHKIVPPAPPPVHELDVVGPDGAAFTQRWKRNTLLLDMSAASGTGSVTLTPVAGSAWPVRIAVRVRPGAFAVLEVLGAQRLALPISPVGTAPVDLELPPGVYTPRTPQLALSWGPGSAPPP